MSQCQTEHRFSSFNIFQGQASPPVSKIFIAFCIGCIVNSVFWSQFRIGKKKTFLTKLFHVQHKRKSVPFQHKRLSNDVSRMAESEENSALRVLPKGSQELVPGASAGGIGAPMRPPLGVIVYAVSKFNISGIQRVDSHSDTRLRPRANSILR